MRIQEESKLLDLNHPQIKSLVSQILAKYKCPSDIIGICYSLVKEQVKFGYSKSDNLSASEVLKDGYGQCNTKATLLMSLLISCGFDVRLRGALTDKRAYYGNISGYFYDLAADEVLHSWVEVYYKDDWYSLEGIILDQEYIESLQEYMGAHTSSFCGYSVACFDLQEPDNEWLGGNSTSILRQSVIKDLGIYDTPDEFFRVNGMNPIGINKTLFKYVMRPIMNYNVQRLRNKLMKSLIYPIIDLEEIDVVSIN